MENDMHLDRNPFQIATLIVATGFGTVAIFGSVWPQSVEDKIPSWFNVLWGILFIIGALLGLVGISLRDRALGVSVEQVGLVCLFATSYVCVATVFFVSPGELLVLKVLLIILGTTCLTQWVRLEIMMRGIISKAHNTRGKRRWVLP